MSQSKYRPNVNMPERALAAYWEGPITRKEGQGVFDEFRQAVGKMAQGLQTLDLTVSYLADKFAVTPEEVIAWAQAKMEQSKKDNAPVDDVKPLVSID